MAKTKEAPTRITKVGFEDPRKPNLQMEASHLKWIATQAARLGLGQQGFLRQFLEGFKKFADEKGDKAVDQIIKQAGPPRPISRPERAPITKPTKVAAPPAKVKKVTTAAPPVKKSSKASLPGKGATIAKAVAKAAPAVQAKKGGKKAIAPPPVKSKKKGAK